MACFFRFAPRAAALALGVAALASGCGSEDGGDDTTENSSLRRRQRTDGEPPSDPAANSANDADAEGAQQGNREETDPGAAALDSGDEAAVDEAEVTPPAQEFAACWTNGGRYDCDSISVIVRGSEPERCVQLSIDNCGGYSRRTLGAEMPSGWDLVSGSIGPSAQACAFGVFNPSNTVVVNASGTVNWSTTAPEPTDLELALTLEPSQTMGAVPSIDIATPGPLELGECPE